MDFNRSSRRKRGMASNPLFTIPDFFLHFPNELCYGYLRFEENAKKNLVFHFEVGRHASFLQKPVVKWFLLITKITKLLLKFFHKFF